MKKYFYYGSLIVVLAILPSLHLFPSLVVYDEKRFLQLVLLLLVGLLYIFSQHCAYYSRFKHQPASNLQKERADAGHVSSITQWGLGLFFGLGLLSTAVNGGWYYSLQELSLYILLIVFLVYTAHIYREVSGVKGLSFQRGMRLLLLLFGGLYALKFFIGYGMHLFTEYPIWPGSGLKTAFFGFANVRFFNQLQVWTLPLFVMFAVGVEFPYNIGKRKFLGFKSSYFFLFLSSFWWCLIISSGGRGAGLSLIISSLFVLTLFKSKAKDYLKIYWSTFLIGLTFYFLLFVAFLPNYVASNTLLRTSSSWRLFVWQNTLEGIMLHPFIGYGPLQFAAIQHFTDWAHPHNSVLQIAYEYGLPAMLLVLGLVLWGLYRWFKQGQSAENKTMARSMLRLNNIRIGLSTSLLAGLGYSLFSGVIVMPLSQLWMALIAGWALGIYYSTINADKGGDAKDLSGFQNLTGLLGKAIVFAAIVFMSYSLIQEVPHLKENQQHYIEKYDNKFHPRFWQQGKIIGSAELEDHR